MSIHFISLAEAKEMTKNLRDNRERILGPTYQGQDIIPICESFEREAFEALLATTDCQKIRIYLGMNAEMKIQMVAVAVNANNEDLLPGPVPDAQIIEKGDRCPFTCPQPSELNS